MSLDVNLIQKALRDALVAANVAGGRIYDADQAQTDANAPYVEIGEWDVQPDDTGDSIGLDAVATLHIWDNQPQARRVQAVADAIRTAIHRTQFTLTGMTCLDVQVGGFNAFTDQDQKHRHGILRVTVTAY
jgi:hypothetical protein